MRFSISRVDASDTRRNNPQQNIVGRHFDIASLARAKHSATTMRQFVDISLGFHF